MKKLLLVALSTFTLSAHAWQPTFYVGANAGSWQLGLDQSDARFSIGTLEAVAGVGLFQYLAAEVRAGAGLTKGREFWEVAEGAPSARTDINLNHYASAYLRPFIANDRASLYGLLGVSSVEWKSEQYVGSQRTDSAKDTEVDASWGVGVSFVVNPKVEVTAEWKKLINADLFSIRGGTLGFVYKF